MPQTLLLTLGFAISLPEFRSTSHTSKVNLGNFCCIKSGEYRRTSGSFSLLVQLPPEATVTKQEYASETLL